MLRRGRRRLLALTLSVFLALGGVALGYNLTLSTGRRDAASGVALIARMVPRTSGYRLQRCRRTHGGVGCTFQLKIRALSGGTITCTAKIQVTLAETKFRRGRRTLRERAPISTFPGKPVCVRRPLPKG